jgi:uncharacterized membrane protein
MTYRTLISWSSVSAILALSILSLFHVIAHETLGMLEAILLSSIWISTVTRNRDDLSVKMIGVLALLASLIAYGLWLNPLLFIYIPAIGINLLLLTLFLGSLMPGHEPIITRIARIIKGELDTELSTYTRRITLAWALFFTALSIESIVVTIYAATDIKVLFVNIINYILVAAFFMAEYIYRKFRFRNHEHVSPLVIASNISQYGFVNLFSKHQTQQNNKK